MWYYAVQRAWEFCVFFPNSLSMTSIIRTSTRHYCLPSCLRKSLFSLPKANSSPASGIIHLSLGNFISTLIYPLPPHFTFYLVTFFLFIVYKHLFLSLYALSLFHKEVILRRYFKHVVSLSKSSFSSQFTAIFSTTHLPILASPKKYCSPNLVNILWSLFFINSNCCICYLTALI